MEGRTDTGAVREAAGGGEGGQDRDEEWRKVLAAAWSQSNAERGALRSQYAAVRGMIREAKDDPDLGVFDAAMPKIEKLHEQVQRPMEQLADGETLLDLANVLVTASKSENRDGPTSSEFVTALLRKFGVRASPLGASNEPFPWLNLGAEASPLFMTATGCHTMHGPMDLTIKERRHSVRRKSGRLGTTRPAELDELAPDRDERNDTDDNMAVMFALLRRNRRAKLENLVLNRQSFAQTVENIFALSFLVKDGRAAINIDDNGDHLVMPKNAPAAGFIASGQVFNSQFVFRFDSEDWKIMKGVVRPGQELMPHRNYNHGDQCKNTQSCPARDGSQLADSIPLKECEEFANKAMEEDLTMGCSCDDILKRTRKRSLPARRLFASGDY
ncbi:hypothetical protein ACP70R_017754 [Stipagrostis hirtigluma subsp. patula]